jgi:FeS assembly SUF system protein
MSREMEQSSAEIPYGAAKGQHDSAALEGQIVRAIQQVYDPEIPVNIYDLGLIYGIDVYPLGRVTIRMTLTSPACPVAGSLIPEVERRAQAVDGVSEATVELVWDPPWTMDMMSEEAKLELNLL